jgi:hypothetical protein
MFLDREGKAVTHSTPPIIPGRLGPLEEHNLTDAETERSFRGAHERDEFAMVLPNHDGTCRPAIGGMTDAMIFEAVGEVQDAHKSAIAASLRKSGGLDLPSMDLSQGPGGVIARERNGTPALRKSDGASFTKMAHGTEPRWTLLRKFAVGNPLVIRVGDNLIEYASNGELIRGITLDSEDEAELAKLTA